MPIPTSIARLYETGDAWLADCSALPSLVRLTWEQEELAPITSGRSWLAARTRLVAAVHALDRMDEGRGPVLAHPETDTAWWLVPLDAADRLGDARWVRMEPAGSCLLCPPTGWQLDGRFWLHRPDGSGLLTDPAVLAAALSRGAYRLPSEAS